jgi:hypothetical protein
LSVQPTGRPTSALTTSADARVRGPEHLSEREAEDIVALYLTLREGARGGFVDEALGIGTIALAGLGALAFVLDHPAPGVAGLLGAALSLFATRRLEGMRPVASRMREVGVPRALRALLLRRLEELGAEAELAALAAEARVARIAARLRAPE